MKTDLTPQQRKDMPIVRGALDYFPDAILYVSEVSRVGNEQHNPGEPMHWAKEKSQDEADALVRHLLDRGTFDSDGLRHSGKVAWRALALLQRELDAEAPVATLGSDFDPQVITGGLAGLAAMEYHQAHEGEVLSVQVENRGEWPPDTRVSGRLTCCGQSEHPITCPQWR